MAPPPQPSLGAALELALLTAATDPTFREAFRQDPVQAARSLDLALTPAEEALLAALPPTQPGPLLDALARHAAQGGKASEATTPEGSSAVAPAGIRPERLACQGIRPDGPTLPSLGIRPDSPSPVRGLQPELPPVVRGIRPGRLAVAAVATATALGAGAVTLGSKSCSERPVAESPAEPSPDAGVERTDGDAQAPASPRSTSMTSGSDSTGSSPRR